MAETTNIKLYRIPWYKKLWTKWFGWRGINLPKVKRIFVTTSPKTIFKTEPLKTNISKIFYLTFDYELKDTNFDIGIDITAQQIVKGIKI